MKIQAKIENGHLIVAVPMNATPVPSSSGKTRVVASTHGNVTTEVLVDGKPVIVGFNAYIK